MRYSFCPKCGGPLAEKYIEEEQHTQLVCTACSFIFYQNSKPTSSALVIKDGKILLGKRIIEPESGKWDIPGGFLESGEHPEIGLHREVKEELGIDVKVEKLLGIFMDEYGSSKEPTLNIAYIVSPLSENLIKSDEHSELSWFSKDELPVDQIAFKNGRMMIEAWLKEQN